MTMTMTQPEWPYVWRVRTRPLSRFPATWPPSGERLGQACRVLARGRMNSCLVEFQDGAQFVTSRNYLRKAQPS